MFEEMINCPMRHKNGNCFPCGGICTEVDNEMCKALRTAYQSGYSDSCADSIKEFDLCPHGERRELDD